MSAPRMARSVKPILGLLPRFLENIVVSFRADLPDPCLACSGVVNNGGALIFNHKREHMTVRSSDIGGNFTPI